MAVHYLNTPLSEADVRKLNAGDVVYLTGPLFGIRDATQIRIFDHGIAPPFDLTGAACIHTAPSVRKVGDRYEKVVVGTTTSTRMDRFTPGLIKQYGVRAVIGKGGLYQGSVDAMKEQGACYLAITGGAAALETTQIEEIEEVAWEDLMPECFWKFRVKELGPLIVGIDSHGNNLYANVKAEVAKRMPDLYKKLGIGLSLLAMAFGLMGCGHSYAGENPVVAGRQVFEKAGCLNCHAVNGQGGTVRQGPDLSKVASRLSREQIEKMVRDPRGQVPATKMPAYTLPREQMDVLFAYLESLH